MHMHVPTGAPTCDPLSWVRVFLLDTITFPTLCRWLTPLAIGTVTGHHGSYEPSGAMSASNAGQLWPDMSGPHMANFIVGRKNCEIRRLGFQLPIAPSSRRARETRPQLENGIARSRALKVPALGFDQKDFQAVGYAGRLKEPMRSDGVLTP